MSITLAGQMVFAAVMVGALCGCQQAAIAENQKQVTAIQAQVQEMQKQIAALKTQQSYSTAASVPGAPGTCDKAVRDTATRRGGDAFVAGDLQSASGYYQDAVTACPTSARAQVNLARVYEKMGERANAIAHYRTAASLADSDTAAVKDARAALSRLAASH
jgi:tetratricopeptide (TPR) repeat protein